MSIERDAAIADGVIPTPGAITSFAGLAPSASEVNRAVALTIDDLKQFKFDKLHTSVQPKSLDWALENETIDATGSPGLQTKFREYVKSLEALAKPARGGGKGGKGGKKGKPESPVLDAFRKHCEALGVKFVLERQADIITLLAAVKARAADAY